MIKGLIASFSRRWFMTTFQKGWKFHFWAPWSVGLMLSQWAEPPGHWRLWKGLSSFLAGSHWDLEPVCGILLARSCCKIWLSEINESSLSFPSKQCFSRYEFGVRGWDISSVRWWLVWASLRWSRKLSVWKRHVCWITNERCYEKKEAQTPTTFICSNAEAIHAVFLITETVPVRDRQSWGSSKSLAPVEKPLYLGQSALI